jgi:ABC-type multidrug transport system fused ATPase/permease subunit
MFSLLALIGLFVILWWISKVLKKVSLGLASASVVLADLAAYYNKKPVINNRVLRQNINAEEKLHTITGEASNATYTQKVRDEIAQQERAINGL